MLLTLVENAIKHGLTPRPGGRPHRRARARRGRSSCASTSRTPAQGFTKSGGGGTGLANTRARLASHFGERASLSLAINAPQGVIATLRASLRGHLRRSRRVVIGTDTRRDIPRGLFATAIDAVRGIGKAQIRVTVVLGLCLTLVTFVVYIVPISQIARTQSVVGGRHRDRASAIRSRPSVF